MGIAALIIGIISIILGCIPFCNLFAIVPALVALVLGIIDWVKKKKNGEPKGKAIAGTICGAVALVVIVVTYIIMLVFGIGTAVFNSSLNDYDYYDYYDDYDYDYDYYDYYDYY